MIAGYQWTIESPFCLGLGQVVGEEAPFQESDLQFAMQLADFFWDEGEGYVKYSSLSNLQMELEYGFNA